jgi:hypothetical protein
VVSQLFGWMMIVSGAKKLDPAVLTITFASATELSSAASFVYWLMPERPKIPTSSFVPAPRSSWRSSSSFTNSPSRPFR